MNSSTNVDYWRIGPYELGLIQENGGAVHLSHQTPDLTLLSTLALAGMGDVAVCALDIIFGWGSKCDSLYDALAAYAYRPLEPPPAASLQRFRAVDWRADCPPDHLYAILLAGLTNESDILLLLRILQNLASGYRDGALFAASSFPEQRFIQAVASLALRTNEHTLLETGEMQAFLFCFRRWLDIQAINEAQLAGVFASLAAKQRCRIPWKSLMNYVICRHWRRVPFPGPEIDEQ